MPTFVLEKQKIIIFVPCKCGTRLFQSLNNLWSPIPNYHDFINYQKIAVLRDPTERFISAINQKIFYKPKPGLSVCENEIDHYKNEFYYLYEGWDGFLKDNIYQSIENFSQDLLSDLIDAKEPHFVTQSSSWHDIRITPDIFLPLHRISDWFLDNLKIEVQTVNKSKNILSTDLLTLKTYQKLYQVYDQDYHTWEKIKN